MPPRSPLPRRDGLDASWIRTPDRTPQPPPWTTIRDFLVDRVGAHTDVDGALASGRFVDQTGRPWRADDDYRPNAFVWFHRRRAAEPLVPGELSVLYSDNRIVVVDKPHFLASTPRGVHVTESVVARLRVQPGHEDATPAHRLDRLTAGVLLLTRDRGVRAAYAGLFASGQIEKTYEAIAPVRQEVSVPSTLIGRIEKRRTNLQSELVEGEPNAVTQVDLLATRDGYGLYRLRPSTGRTHQLRLQLSAIGIPIHGDPLYPEVRDVDPADFTDPLRLVARSLRFVDPVDGTPRLYTSGRPLLWPDGAPASGLTG